MCQVPVWPSAPMNLRCVPLLGTSVAGNGHSNYRYLWLSRMFSWLSLNQDKELKPRTGLPQQPLIWSPMTCAWTRPTWQILWVWSIEQASCSSYTALPLSVRAERWLCTSSRVYLQQTHLLLKWLWKRSNGLLPPIGFEIYHLLHLSAALLPPTVRLGKDEAGLNRVPHVQNTEEDLLRNRKAHY